jgi:hypothetical protein
MSAVLELQEKQETEVEKPSWPAAVPSARVAARELQPLLFADVLLEVDGAEKRRRGLAAISSTVLQSLLPGDFAGRPADVYRSSSEATTVNAAGGSAATPAARGSCALKMLEHRRSVYDFARY